MTFKAVILLTRRDGTSHGDFEKWWLGTHRPLAQQLPGLRRAVFNLVQNPKTPPSLTSRWLPLLRTSDLKNLAKSKQVPSNVSLMAKRMLSTREG